MNRANILTVSSWVALCILSLVYTVTIVTTNRDGCSKLEEQAKIDRQKEQELHQKNQALHQKNQALLEQYQQEIKEYDQSRQNIEKTMQEMTKSTNQIRGKQGLPPCKLQNGEMVCPEK